MLEFPLKKLHIINYFLIAFIFLIALLFTRDIINIALSKKGSRAVKTGDKTTANIMPAKKNIMSYAPIVEKNPFGPPMKFHPIATGQNTNSSQGSLSELMLFGTVTGPKNLSHAIFTDKSQPAPVRQEVFAYGEDIYNSGTLTKIEKGFVELTQGTNTYIIYLIDITGIQTKRLHTNISSASQSQFVKKINERQYLLDQRKLQQALNNPKQILTDARPLPNIQKGKQDGFRISEVRPGGLYESLGLRNGDILLRVNELEISNPEVAMQAMFALKGMNMVNLDIIRSGSKMTMSYQIR